ncbi:MAG: GDYXXLXY domain-containing protein [Cyanobacteriota bacterium]|nr:GDYXXLXY domain-containing protein [Cyanobacteriota bacterium]
MNTDLPSPNGDRQPTPNAPQTNRKASKPLSSWRLWVPLLVQSVLAISIPLQDAYTYMVGESIVLQTSPAKSETSTGGDRRQLSYDISHPEKLKRLDGGREFFARHWGERNFSFYITLEAPIVRYANSPLPWQPVRVTAERPQNLARNQISLKGRVKGRRVLYGLESYHTSAKRHAQVNHEVTRVRSLGERPGGSFVVEVKVDERGHGVPVSLWVGDRHYRF